MKKRTQTFVLSDAWLSLILAILAILSRVPFLSRYLYHWDSVNYALSLENFDVRLHQPHPPGYILYSMAGKLLKVFFNDDNTALVILSLLGGVCGVVGIYFLGKWMFSRTIGVVATLLTLTSPLHWFYSEVALNYALAFALVIGFVWACNRVWMGEERYWLLAAISLGILGGVRQNDLAFLVPVWLLSLSALGWKQRWLSLAALAVVISAWLIPMIAFSGGVSEYLLAVSGASGTLTGGREGGYIEEFVLNGGRLVIYLAYGITLGLGFIPLAAGIILKHRQLNLGKRSVFLLMWILPAALFYLFIHIRQPGHIFVFLPALILITAWSVNFISRHLFKKTMTVAQACIVGGVVLLNLAFFLLAPPALLGSQQLPLQTPSMQTINSRDSFIHVRLDAIRKMFDPTETVVLAGGLNIRHPDYYLASFCHPELSYQLGEKPVVLDASIKAVVLFDNHVFPQLDPSLFEVIQLSPEDNLRVLRVQPGERVEIHAEDIIVIRK